MSIRYAHRAFVKALALALEPHGISPGEWSACGCCGCEEGLTQVELAERMRVEKASLTGVLSSLEAKGLIARVRNLQDRRKINLRLTAAGRRMEGRVLACGLAVNESAARGISRRRRLTCCATCFTAIIANLDGERFG